MPREPRQSAPLGKEIVNGLDQREIKFGIIASAFDLALTLLAYFLVQRHSSNPTIRQDAGSFLVAGIVGCGLLVMGTAFRRRALLGFASFIVGLEILSFHGVYGIFFIFFGGWLIKRVMTKQKQDQAAGRSRSSIDTKPDRRIASGPPKASKRYTPPRRSRNSPARKR